MNAGVVATATSWATVGFCAGCYLVACAGPAAPKGRVTNVPLSAATPEPAEVSIPTVRYCAGTVTEFEVHHCIFELTPHQQKRRAYSQRLTYDAGQLVRFEEVNGRGMVRPGSKVSEYEYENDRITGWKERTSGGTVVGRIELSEDSSWARWLDERGRPDVSSGDRVSGLKRKLDSRGRVIAYTYVDATGNPTPSSSERIVVRPRRNAAGALFEQAYFDADGLPMRDKYGVHREVFTLNAMLVPTRTEYFDEQGEPVTNTDGVHRTEVVFDAVGNSVEEKYFDLVGNPTINRASGAASYRVSRNAHGEEIARSYFDVQGQLTVSEFGYATRKKVLDELGRPVEWSFLGVDGEPMLTETRGHALKRVELDAHGNPTLELYFGVDGSPILAWTGYHAIELSYDDRDQQTGGRFLGLNMEPLSNRYGYAAWRYYYDGNRRTATEWLGLDGQAVPNWRGCARLIQHYDELGAKAEEVCLGVDGQPVVGAGADVPVGE